MRREWACPRRSSVDALFTVKWLTAATFQAAIAVSAIHRAHGLVGGGGGEEVFKRNDGEAAVHLHVLVLERSGYNFSGRFTSLRS